MLRSGLLTNTSSGQSHLSRIRSTPLSVGGLLPLVSLFVGERTGTMMRLRAVAGDILLVNWLMGSHQPLGEPGNQDHPCPSLSVEVAVLLEVSMIFGQLV